jgi:hypothetical protein
MVTWLGAEGEEKKAEEEGEEEEPDLPGMQGSEEYVGPKAMWVVTKGCFNEGGAHPGQGPGRRRRHWAGIALCRGPQPGDRGDGPDRQGGRPRRCVQREQGRRKTEN